MSGDSDRDPLLVSLLSPLQPILFVCHVNGSFTTFIRAYLERIKKYKALEDIKIPSGKT